MLREISDVHGRLKVAYQLLDLSQDESFLDVGCAWGYLENRLSRLGMKKVYAIDVNEARKKGILPMD